MDPLDSTPNPASDASHGSNSKVRVEYTDPSGVFAQVAPELQSRLPLRSLNWNSQSRPLRSIDSLFVELVPDQANAGNRPTSSSGAEEGAGRRSESPPKRERRHQIPGLRSTPYLKLYLLRCDDSDTYKASARRLVREWIKANSTPAKKSGSKADHENHDAFEWLIVHVAPIDGSNPWPSKALGTVVEKLRSDFNTSSKSSVDRIAQIPFAGDFQVQGATSDAVPAGPAREQFIRESNRAWDSLMLRFKTLILMSFDERVRQYEDDIKERAAQRNIPGWNFCTFFMFKEGLALGFEKVGLLDDALVGYDELSVELLSAIRHYYESAAMGEDTGLFRDHTKDLFEQADAAWTGQLSSPRRKTPNKLSTSFLDAEEKPYRELIMANNVSVFDFRCYVFVRQIAVLLRIAYSSSAKAIHGGDHATADPSTLAEICRRAVSFIASTSRSVRHDVKAAFHATSDEGEELAKMRYNIVENIVASWIYSTAQQILAQTEDRTLAQEIERIRSNYKDQEDRRSGSIPSISTPFSSKSPQGRNNNGRLQSATASRSTDTLSEDRPATFVGPLANQRKAALASLAFQRAELIMIARKALKGIGERAGWDYISTDAQNPTMEEMDNVDLDAKTSESSANKDGAKPSSRYFLESLTSELLREAFVTDKAFHKAYEESSWQAHHLYQYANDENSVHAILADIATLKFHVRDFAVAASYFHQLAPFYADRGWTELEVAVLDRYAWCLKDLGRDEDYVRIGLKLLSKSTSIQLANTGLSRPAISASTRDTLQFHLKKVLDVSSSFKEPIKSPLKNYFLDVDVTHQIQHLAEVDGFAVKIRFTHAMMDAITAEAVTARLLGIGDTQGREIILKTQKVHEITPGKNEMLLVSKSLFPGRYYIESISIHAANILFHYQPPPPENNEVASNAASGVDRGLNNEPIILWLGLDALQISASPQAHIHLEQSRSIQFEIASGLLKISTATLQLKAGSAGLRMHISEAKVLEGDCEIIEIVQPNTIHLSAIQPHHTIHLSVPYQLDNDLKDIQFRSEITYSTDHGDFRTGDNHSFTVNLPLGVNVQDIFQEKALYSKFSITTSSSIPLRILHCRVDDTDDYKATTPYQDPDALAVFPKQPVSMVYRIVRAGHSLTAKDKSHSELDAHLLMHISYQCLDEEIAAATLASLAEAVAEHHNVQSCLPLLKAHLRVAIKERLPRYDLNTIGLLREFPMPGYTELHWDRVLLALAPPQRPAIQKWLEEWHAAHGTINLDPPPSPPAPGRLITIPVDVPSMPVLHTARLVLPAFDHLTAPHVGTPLAAILHIRHTRVWAQQSAPKEGPLRFTYELDASPDTWLLGGPRRRAFVAAEGEETRFEVTLVPLRAGRLLLPGLDVRFAEDEKKESKGSGAGDEGSVIERNCEVDYLSQGETVLVVPGVGSISAGLGFDDLAAGVEDAGHGSGADRVALPGPSWVVAAEGYGQA